MEKKEKSFGQKMIENLTYKIASLERDNSALFVENQDYKIENKKLQDEISKYKEVKK